MCPKGKLQTSSFMRTAGSLPMEKAVAVSGFTPEAFLSSISVEVAPVGKSMKVASCEVDAAELAQGLVKEFANHVYKRGQVMVYKYRRGDAEGEVDVKLKVLDFEVRSEEEEAAGGAGAGAGGKGAAAGARGPSHGVLRKDTAVKVSKDTAAANLKLVGSSSTKGMKLVDKGFNFADLGIGGLDGSFQTIFRSAFASRMIPPAVLKRMSQTHIKGMLLYGPPGCGKTLIARQLGKALHAHPPKIVNGPELLNKYVGASEENVRLLFADAEKEQEEKGDDSDLHIIILDEMDAILKVRGSSGGGTGVGDQVVNQFLTKIDGVDSLNNVLIIGMTNRKDLIDPAILRPGRLELHVEIGLPDETGRVQQLEIHTKAMRASGMLAADVDLVDLAKRTKNYTGAEIKGLVTKAQSFFNERNVDLSNPDKVINFDGLQVTMSDFLRALPEMKPAFGIKEDELDQLFSNGIIPYSEEFSLLSETIDRLAGQVLESERTQMASVLLAGPPGSGKSALAASLARRAGFPFVKRISGSSLINERGEEAKCQAIVNVFMEAYKSPASIVILDDIERAMDFVSVGPRFSNPVLQTLLVLVKDLPPQGHRLLVIGTTSVMERLEEMDLTRAFNLVLEVPMLVTQDHYAKVLAAAEPSMAARDIETVGARLAGIPVGIKKLLNIIDMAKHNSADTSGAGLSGQALLDSAAEWGVV